MSARGSARAPGAAAAIDTAVAIETPEHIVFHHRVAGPARRALAHLVDLLLCYGAVLLLGVVVVLAGGAGASGAEGDLGASTKAGIGVLLVALFAAQWIYFLAWEATRGASPGKKWLGLRVLTTEGRPVGWRAAALRNLLRAADLLPAGYVAGLASMALTTRFQRLGDLVAGTMVVIPDAHFREHRRTTRGDRGALDLTPPAKPSELATLPDDVALDADEREAIELFLRRRDRLGRAREQELAEMIAPALAARLGFRHADPSRLLAIVYDRAVNEGRTEAPPSSSFAPRAKKARAKPQPPRRPS